MRFRSLSARTLSAAASFVLLAACLLSPARSAQAQSPDDRKVVDRIAAVVADEIVLKSDVDQMVSQMTQQSQQPYSKDLWMQALNQLVDQAVLTEHARRDTNITVSDEQVTSRLEMQIDQMKQQAGGEEQLEQYYGKSVVELREEYREVFRDQMLAQQYRQTRMRRIDITPSEVRQWFERIPQDSLPRLPETVRLAHIVRYPKPSENAKQQARDIITTIRDSVVNKGASFEEMARQFSDDPGTASEGGRLSGISLNELVPEFAAIAARTPIGEVSQVFYNDQHDGYHILRVNSRNAGTVDLNHILIRVSETSSDASVAKEHLSAVRDTLIEYPDVPFELMARRHSEEDRSAENGGRVTDPQQGVRDLVLSRLGPSWRRTVNSLDIGDISQPAEVQLLNGERAYHIVLLQRRMPAHRVNLEDDYDRIRQYALQEKQQRVMQDWLSDLREDVYVDIRIQRSDLTASMRRR